MKKFFTLTLALGLIVPVGFAEKTTTESNALYQVTVKADSTPAINYRYLKGSTKIGFRGTVLDPHTTGIAKIKSKKGAVHISAEFENLEPASKFGPDYATYVLWAISPEGRATNLGELILDDGESELNVTTQMQTFGLIVTAEPYFAVTQVSNVVVLENVVLKDTKGEVKKVEANYELLKRGKYAVNVSPDDLKPRAVDKKVSPYLYQARNAIRIAQAQNASTFATDSFTNAKNLLAKAEEYQVGKRKYRKQVPTLAREAIQIAEDSRLIAEKRFTDQEYAKRELILEDKALIAEQKTAEAMKAKQAASTEAEKAKLEAEKTRMALDKAEQEKGDLRAQLSNQLNSIMQTKDSARGLIVSMSDVLFESGRYKLKPGARENLAKISGILMAHPGLNLVVEGHTDSVGKDENNQVLSERRANTVKEYLIKQGIPQDSIVSHGYGEANPISSNDSAEGRQQNRRVELVVTGDIIGTGNNSENK